MKNNNDDKIKEVLKPKVINNEDDKEKEKKEVYEKLLNGNVPEDDINKKSTGLTKTMVGIAAGAVVAGAVTMAVLATTDDELDSHTISFDYNIEMEEVYSSEEVKVGARVGDLVPRKVRGYKFMGWFKDESFTQPYSDDDIIPTNAIVYGKYLPVYKVEFPKETVGYSFVIEDKEIVSGDDYSFEIKLLDSHSKSSVKAYLIRGEGERTELTPNAKGKYTIKNIESHCKIEVEGVVLNTYTVTFKNGVNVLKKETITHNEFAIGDDIEEPAKEHHKFIGWGVTTDKEELVNLSEYNIKEDTILHAKFEQLQYTVQFVSGNDDLSRYDFTYGGGDYLPTSLSLPTPTPDKASTEEYFYVFAGWSLTENGELITDFSSVQIVGDTKLYAVYTEYSFMNVSLSIEGNLTTYEMQVGANLKENINALVANDTIDITDENSIGWYYDDKFSKPVLPDDLVPYKATLYTRYATLDKISIVDGVASAIDNTISGEVVIPACVRELGNDGFIRLDSLDGVFIPYGVEVIGNFCFRGSALNSVNIPSSVTTIGDYAFSRAINVSEITIPESVTTIGENAFSYCSFESVKFNAKVKSIPYEAFAGCENLKEINIPIGVETIGEGAFAGCRSLEAIELPEGLISLDYFSFGDCEMLSTINIPSTVTQLGGDFGSALEGSYSLINVNIHTENKYFMVEDGTIFSKDKKVLYYYFDRSQTSEYLIPNCVEIIVSGAFWGADNLTRIEFEEGSRLETIGDYAFGSCGITEIMIPASVITIGEGVFYESWDLARIEFEEGSRLETIGNCAFECCGITEIIIPASVTTIGWSAFFNCENLTKVFFEDIHGWYLVEGGEIPYAVFADQGALAEEMKQGNPPIFKVSQNGNLSLLTLSIVNEDIVSYIGIPKGEGIWDSLVAIEDTISLYLEDIIGLYLDEECTIPVDDDFVLTENITLYTMSVTWGYFSMSAGEIYVGQYDNKPSGWLVLPKYDGFWNEELQTSEYVVGEYSIRNEAFDNCDNLTGVYIPSSITKIGAGAFSNCDNLTSVIFEGDYAWSVNGNILTTQELSNPTIAAKYLTDEYAYTVAVLYEYHSYKR